MKTTARMTIVIALFVVWTAGPRAQLVHNIPDLCAGSSESVPTGQTVTLSGVLVKDCIGVPQTSTVLLADNLDLRVTNLQVLGRIDTVNHPARGIRIRIRDVVPTDFEEWGTSLLMLGPINLVGETTMTWTRLTADAPAGATSVQLADVTGISVGGQLVFGDERHLVESHENDPRVTQYVSVTSVSGKTVNFPEPLQIAHKAAKNADGSAFRYPPVGYVTRSIVVESENPNGTRGHVAWTGAAAGLIKGVRFRNLGRTPNDAFSNAQAGRYGGCHFHMNTGAVTFTGSVVENPMKWGCTVHGVTGQTLTDNLFINAKGWGWGTENGQEHDNLIERNLTINTTGDGNRGDRGRDQFDHPIMIGTAGVGGWATRTKDHIRNNVDVGSLVACFMLWGDRATPITEFTGNECWGSRAGLTQWDTINGTILDFFESNTWLGQFNYASRGITYQNWRGRGDPSAIPTSCFESTGIDFGDYSTMESRVVNADIQNKCEGIRPPWAIADVFPGTETTPRTFTIEDSSFANNRTDIGFHTGTSSTGLIKPVHTTIVRRTHHVPSSAIWIANTGPVQPGDPDPVFLVDDFQGVAGDDVTVYSADYAPTTAGTRPKFLDRVSSGTPVDLDSDGDGVKDSLDKCPGTPAGMPVDATGCPIVTPPQATVTVNPAQVFQTMQGWEGAVLASISDYQGLTPAQLDALLTLAVDLGATRARLAIRNGAEGGGSSSFSPVNDNTDPNVLDSSKFDFSALDYEIDRFIVPLRQKLQAKGGRFYTGLQYVDHAPNTPFEHWQNPAEYGEFMVAVFTHMRDKYGFVPDGIDVVNEPDGFDDWQGGNSVRIGQVAVAAAQRLQAAGFTVPEFIFPSTANASNAPGYADTALTVPGASAIFTELSYHRYGGNPADPGAKAAQLGKRSAMLEYWGDFVTPNSGANYRILRQDVVDGRASAWQQGAFADYPNCVSQWVHLINGIATPCPNTVPNAQYFKYVRPGARRIGATGTAGLQPTAFIGLDGAYTVVVEADQTGAVTIAGLPAGTYGSTYASGGTSPTTGVNPDVTIAAGQILTANMPVTGVLTVFGKSGVPPADTTPPTVSLTAPADGATVQATVNISATAGDNVGVVGVQFKVDGANFGGEDLSAPYTFSWNTVTVADGPHTLTAVARDAAGLSTTAAPVSVTVNNGPPPPADDDGDGVPNASDLCPGTAPGVKVDANGCAIQPSDVCVTDPLRLTRISWPASNSGRRSLTFDTGTKTWARFTFIWPGTLTVTDTRGCIVTVQR